jgi:prolyl 4-hydroxylase
MDQTLEQKAQAGDAAAQIALGQQFEAQGRHDMARGWFARAAQAGDTVGLRQLAISLLVQMPGDIGQGIAMIKTAADRGDAEACHLCAVLAGQDSRLPNNWSIANDYLAVAADAGHTLARDQLRLLSAGAPRIDTARWLTPAAATAAREAPRIAVAPGFASAAECDWLIERARPGLRAAEVYDPGGAGGLRADDIRSNSAASFNLAQLDLVMTLMRARIARWAGLSTDDMEPLAVLHYDVGQQFAPHYDFVEPENPQLEPNIARYGQRFATCLIYLNDDFEGGETDFPDIDYRFKGRKGDAILFWNVTPDAMPDRKTLHAGLAPTRGEKWLLSQWMRGRAGG